MKKIQSNRIKVDQASFKLNMETSMDNDERQCDCNNCKYCKAYLSSDYDYETKDYECSRCNGAGCTSCEE